MYILYCIITHVCAAFSKNVVWNTVKWVHIFLHRTATNTKSSSETEQNQNGIEYVQRSVSFNNTSLYLIHYNYLSQYCIKNRHMQDDIMSVLNFWLSWDCLTVFSIRIFSLQEKNPLYQSPTQTVYNPTYTGRKQKTYSWLMQ